MKLVVACDASTFFSSFLEQLLRALTSPCRLLHFSRHFEAKTTRQLGGKTRCCGIFIGSSLVRVVCLLITQHAAAATTERSPHTRTMEPVNREQSNTSTRHDRTSNGR